MYGRILSGLCASGASCHHVHVMHERHVPLVTVTVGVASSDPLSSLLLPWYY